MTKPRPTEPDEVTDPKGEEGRQLTTLVGRGVLTALGRPTNFLKVVVVRLWDDNFRVNVLTGDDTASARIAHSYFVAADDRGNVVQSTPALVKQY